MALDSKAFADGHPLAIYRRLTECRGPTRGTDVDGRPVWLIARRRDVEAVLKDADTFRSAPIIAAETDESSLRERLIDANMQRSDGPAHARYRRVLDSPAVQRAIAPCERWFRRDVTAFWRDRTSTDPVDVCAALTQPLAARLFAAMAGLDAKAEAQLSAWSLALAAYDDPAERRTPSEKFAMFLTMRAAFRRSAAASPAPETFIGAIERAHRDRIITREEADSFYGLLVTAGVQTMASAMSGWIAMCAGNAAMLASRRGTTIEEALRMSTPAAQFDRFATCDVLIGGEKIARGDHLVVSLGAANHDRERFRAPHRFDPSRPHARSHLAFGAGSHFCLGAKAARSALQWFAEETAPFMARFAVDRERTSYRQSVHVPGYSRLILTAAGET